ncbi:MAG: FAD-dependent oxidoreductase, partial [Gammaproteobacteria bacterium]
ESGVELVHGSARLIDPNTIAVNNRHITAEHILVATGARPTTPDIPGKQYAITSNEAFFLEKLPESITIAGGGYIGVEFAGIFNGLGVKTTLIYRGSLILRGFDVEARQFLSAEMGKKGINLFLNSTIKQIDKNNKDLTVTLHNEDRYQTDMVMFATGRIPDTSGLGLDNAGVHTDGDGRIIVDTQFRTSASSVYAIGDVSNRHNLTPVAIAEGAAFARSVFDKQPANMDYDNIPTCVFSQPELASVGLGVEQAKEQYGEITVYKSEFTPLKHTLTGSGVRNLVKLVVDKATDRVVGAHMVGEGAGEIIQGIAIAVKAGATRADFDATIGIHPTAAEEFVTAKRVSDTK